MCRQELYVKPTGKSEKASVKAVIAGAMPACFYQSFLNFIYNLGGFYHEKCIS